MKNRVMKAIGALVLAVTFVVGLGISGGSLVEAKGKQSRSIQDEDKRALHERRKLEKKLWRKDHHHNYRFWYQNHTNPPAYGYYDRYGTYHPMH